MTIDLTNALVFFLIMIRMTGMLMANPIFSRRNVPVLVNLGLAFVLAVLLTGYVPAPDLPTPSLPMLALWVIKELSLGILAGFLLQAFFAVFIVGGEMVDMQLGLSMAKAFDPGSNSSISISAQFFNIIFVLVFFVSGAHLNFIQMLVQSYTLFPLGIYPVNWDALYMIPQLFSTILLLAVKLSLPVVLIEIVVTFAVGIIMRIIPQINVFVVNIQFKLLIGIFLLVVLVPPFTAFLENIITICMENIQAVWLQWAT